MPATDHPEIAAGAITLAKVNLHEFARIERCASRN
jgi:hypothetical protein